MPVAGAVHRIKTDVHGVISRPSSGSVSVRRNLSGMTITMAVWVNGIDTPEIRGRSDAETELAKQARDFVVATVGDHVQLTNLTLGKYARRVAGRWAVARTILDCGDFSERARMRS